MANVFALPSLATSLARWLGNQYAAAVIPNKPACTFSVVSSNQLAAGENPEENPLLGQNQVTVYLYRATIDPHLRTAGRLANRDMNPVPLSLQAHILFSFWTANANTELLLLGWLMRALHENPVLDRSSLDVDAAWTVEDVIHLIPEELSVEDMARIWDSLTPSYRLSVSYVARVVRLEAERVSRSGAPVVAQRFIWQDRTAAELEATP